MRSKCRLPGRRGSALLALLACCAGAAAEDLPNPFARPEAAAGGYAARRGAQAPTPDSLDLRATLVRGRKSSANFGGTILRVGEKVGGYRLVSVHEGAAVLVDDTGVTYVIEIEPHGQVEP